MRSDISHLKGALPRVRWGAIAAGVLVSLALHIVLGLFGAGLGLAADPADSNAVGAGAAIWGLLIPLVASFCGAYVATRMAASLHPTSGVLHGSIVWCIGLIAGAIFLTGTAAFGAIAAGASIPAGDAAAGGLEAGLGRGADETGSVPRVGLEPLSPSEVVIPLYEEQVQISTRAVVYEQVRVRKDVWEEHEQLEADVRREVAPVEGPSEHVSS